MRSWQIILTGVLVMFDLVVGEPYLRADPDPNPLPIPCGQMCKKTK